MKWGEYRMFTICPAWMASFESYVRVCNVYIAASKSNKWISCRQASGRLDSWTTRPRGPCMNVTGGWCTGHQKEQQQQLLCLCSYNTREWPDGRTDGHLCCEYRRGCSLIWCDTALVKLIISAKWTGWTLCVCVCVCLSVCACVCAHEFFIGQRTFSTRTMRAQDRPMLSRIPA